MCLFVVDGTWSRDFNHKSLGKDRLDISVGNRDDVVRSNARRFYEESGYPAIKKFYYGGPRFGLTGADASYIYDSVVTDIEREIVKGSCTEIAMVGWSRGAAIVSEVAQGMLNKEYARIYKKIRRHTKRGMKVKKVIVDEAKMLPDIKFVGLFDSVDMIPKILGRRIGDLEWGEHIPKNVNYFTHVIAGNRTGPLNGAINFIPANPRINAKRSFVTTIPGATHSDVGGDSSSAIARHAYQIMRSHANTAGVK